MRIYYNDVNLMIVLSQHLNCHGRCLCDAQSKMNTYTLDINESITLKTKKQKKKKHNSVGVVI